MDQSMNRISSTFCACFIGSTILSGCAFVPTESETVKQHTLKSAPAEGMARIYLYRTAKFVGGGRNNTYFVNGKCVGTSAIDTLYAVDAPGGQFHSIALGYDKEYRLQTKANQKYYVRASMEMSMGSAHWAVQLTQNKKQARKALLKSKLGKSDTCSNQTFPSGIPEYLKDLPVEN